MTAKFKWTNRSVSLFAAGHEPVGVMEARARELVLKAMDDGWHGPPFDPLVLAKRLNIRAEARSDIPDARTVPAADGRLTLEYNPLRPKGRLRFSIAHEIAHSLFPDCADEIRNRGGTRDVALDDWQLEVLCNIGAAELLMPLGSFSQLAGSRVSINEVMRLRKEFDVSAEACLIRLIKLSRLPSAAFCASKHQDGSYHLDYVMPSAGWSCPVSAGQSVPQDSVINEASAIGFTAIGDESWGADNLRVECVGLAPYPGSVVPRVVGLFAPQGEPTNRTPTITELVGDALEPRGHGVKLVAHVVPDKAAPWGGGGFAAQVRRRFPHVWSDFRHQASAGRAAPELGSVFISTLDANVQIVHMVAQHGIGPSASQRLRFAPLAECLSIVRTSAQKLGATVHMPRIGTGHGGASWEIIKELITDELVDQGIDTTVYQLPRQA